MNRTYSELIDIPNFEDRFEYLKLDGSVGIETFGYDRYLNQVLYNSKEWRTVRRDIIIRDNGCDMGLEGNEILGKIIIHHMNPITIDDIVRRRSWIFDPEYLICVSHNTHNAIHYSDKSLLKSPYVERCPGDTRLW